MNMVFIASHCWLNKIMGAKTPYRKWYGEGQDVHRIIQDHVSGARKDSRLKDWLKSFEFPVVEQSSFDPKCHWEHPIGELYVAHGYVDGRNDEKGQILEIKSSATPWSVMKYKKSMQRKLYGLGYPNAKEGILITCPRDPGIWTKQNVSIVRIPYTQKDRDEALKWVNDCIQIIENGDFTGGLDEDGFCALGMECPYAENCQFRRRE